MSPTLRALNGFGLGARPGERARVSDPRGWLRAQLAGAEAPVEAPAGATASEIATALQAVRAASAGTPEERRDARRRLVEIGALESREALTLRVAADRPFVERLVAFWSNHLCVSGVGRAPVVALAGSYEREVVRAHLQGRFEEMVLASARHPAMLLYLDNVLSVGPGSPGARAVAPGRPPRGLNENHARELLELHTLGVDGGYTQRDVQEVARVLTGWTVAGLGGPAGGRIPADGPVRFHFHAPQHEPGAKTVLGVRYEEAGAEEGERVIRALCRHPSTARFVAAKLVAHFVSDAPPAPAVARIARVFRDSGGDLGAVSSALVDLPEAWSEGARKFRSPQDWLIALLRAVGAREAPPAAPGMLRQLRHPLWSPPSPKGYSDGEGAWADPDALLNRAELARTVASRGFARNADPLHLLEVMDAPAAGPLRALLSDSAVPARERVALAVAGPAFQWR